MITKVKVIKIGRPTKYTFHTPRRVDNYLKTCGNFYDKHKMLSVKLPTLEGLCRYLDISRDTAYEWAKTYREFRIKIDNVKRDQYLQLINNGLSGRYPSSLVILLLKLNHGMSENREIRELKAFQTSIVKRIYSMADEIQAEERLKEKMLEQKQIETTNASNHSQKLLPQN